MVWFSISLNHCSRDAGTVLIVPRGTQGRSFEHDGVAGVIREIRMMHTVVETFDGKTAYIPNSSISGSRVVNMTRLGRRRVEISVSASVSCGQKIHPRVCPQKIRRDLFPVLKQEEHRQTFDLEGRKEAAKEFLHTLMIPTEEEIEYMNRFSQKEYRPELLFDDPSIIERIIEHPMALWKCKS